MNPLKQKTTALKYLTPQLYANAPRLIRRMDADIFICAQDLDKGWEKNFTVSTPQVKNGTATVSAGLLPLWLCVDKMMIISAFTSN